MATKPASLKPVVHQKLELDLDEGATRVHKFPKELIHRLREQESAKSSGPPAEDRTAVFRAPPELLARAMRARLSAQGSDEPEQAEATGVNDLPTKPPPAGADDQIADSGVQYMSESTSGIALRPASLGGFSAVPAQRAPLVEHDEAQAPLPEPTEGATDDGWSFPEPALDDPTLIRAEGLSLLPSFATHVTPALDESPSISLVESDPVTEALLSTDVDALLAPAPPPAHAFGYVAPEPTAASLAAPQLGDAPASIPAPEATRSGAKRVVLAAALVVLAVATILLLTQVFG